MAMNILKVTFLDLAFKKIVEWLYMVLKTLIMNYKPFFNSGEHSGITFVS